MKIDDGLGPADLLPRIARLWEASAAKIDSIEQSCPPGSPSPVFTVAGRYTARGWTEWTQLPVRFRDPPVRRDRRRALPDDRPGRHDRGDGRPRQPHRRARPRLQQRQHVRQPLAPGERGPDLRGRSPLPRAGPKDHRRGAGGPLADHAGRHRLHLLVQRAAVAVRGHHPVLPRAGRVAPARARFDGRARRADLAARPDRRARAQHRPVQHLVRRRPRLLRPARPHRARVAVQRERRSLPRAEHAAGLLAVQHLDARPGLGHARLPGAAGSSSRPCPTRSSTRSAGATRSPR